MHYEIPRLYVLSPHTRLLNQCMDGTSASGGSTWTLVSTALGCGTGAGANFVDFCLSGASTVTCRAGGDKGECVSGNANPNTDLNYYGPKVCTTGSVPATTNINSACYQGTDPLPQ